MDPPTPRPRGSDPPENAHQSEQYLSQPWAPGDLGNFLGILFKGWVDFSLSGLHTHVRTQRTRMPHPKGPRQTGATFTLTPTISPARAELTEGPFYPNMCYFNPALLPTLPKTSVF